MAKVLQEEVEELKSENGKLKKEIENLQKKVEELKEKSFFVWLKTLVDIRIFDAFFIRHKLESVSSITTSLSWWFEKRLQSRLKVLKLRNIKVIMFMVNSLFFDIFLYICSIYISNSNSKISSCP